MLRSTLGLPLSALLGAAALLCGCLPSFDVVTASACGGSCTSDVECGDNACLETGDGQLCLPAECRSCFAKGESCFNDHATCTFDGCEGSSAGDASYSDAKSGGSGGGRLRRQDRR